MRAAYPSRTPATVRLLLCWLPGLWSLCLATSCLAGPLAWPINCLPGGDCLASIGYPDLVGNGQAYDCSPAGYPGHVGTDIRVTQATMDTGLDVLAAEAGTVLWVFDGWKDHCSTTDANDAQCQAPTGPDEPNTSSGYRRCTALGPYCEDGIGQCFWCFYGGNVVVIKHDASLGVFATGYQHLKTNSIVVVPGQVVKKGQKIAQVGDAGNSTGPHLHFDVWEKTYADPIDPWMGPCGRTTGSVLWARLPPWGVADPLGPAGLLLLQGNE
ncbi:MAG: M23 family metallopeptidase [Solidesulfovibrio sp. DCME]|uniref:M23 family metallopeptidase n=1 Tax=Solidesulfovibrio sp. DCME TaxID=3447380 RepID=UPI003D13E1B9